MKNKLSLETRLFLVFGCYYMLCCPTLIMYSTYMILAGFSSAMVAALLSLYGIVTILVKPVFALFVDKGHCRMLASGLSAAMAAGTFIFFFASDRTLFHAVAYVVLVSSVSSGLMEIVDSWALKLTTQYPELDYPKFRSTGAITFGVSSLISGFLVSKFGLSFAPYIIFALIAAFVTSVLMVPDPEAGTIVKKSSSLSEIREMLTDRRFIVFVVLFATGFVLQNVIDNYTGVMILEKGGTTAHTGIHDFLKALIEFAVMFQYTKIADRFGTINVLIIGILGLTIKCFSISLMPTAFLIVCTFICQLFAFPLVAPGRMRVLVQLVPANHLALAVSICGTVVALFDTICVNPSMAFMITKMGTAASVRSIGLLGIISAAGLFLYGRKVKLK